MTDSSQPMKESALRDAKFLLVKECRARDDDDCADPIITAAIRVLLAAAVEGEQVSVGWKLTDEMVEVAARALFESGYMININSMPWESESLGEHGKDDWRQAARAALEAVHTMLSSAPASPVREREKRPNCGCESTIPYCSHPRCPRREALKDSHHD